MNKYRSFEDVETEYFHNNPTEIDDYITLIFEEYAKDNNIGALLSSLRTVSRVRGVTAISHTTGLTRKGVQKALSSKGNPKFGNICAIVQAMGYHLVPQKVSSYPIQQTPC